MNLKKLIALVMCVLLVVGLFACAKKQDSSANDSSVNDKVTGQPTEDKSAEEKTTEEKPVEETNATPEMDFDLGGRTIKVVAWWDMSIQGEDPVSVAKKQNLEALMKKHNFKIEYQAIDYGQYHDKLTASLMAGQPIGDIVRIGRAFMIPALVKQDLFWPIEEDWIKNDKVFNQKISKQVFVYKGKIYAFTDALQGLATGIIYNKTLMEKLGLKPLQEYVDEGKWTWDTFIEVAKSANRDTNNDGKIDTWGLATGSVLDQALAANETDVVDEEKEKQNLDDPRVTEALNFIWQLYSQGVPRPSEGGDWTEPRAFFVQGNTLMYPGADWEIGGLKNDMPDYKLGFVPFPKGPSASGYHGCEGLPQAIAIPKAVSNPRELVYIWEKINDIPDELREEWPGQNWYESLFEDEADVNNLRKASEGCRYLVHASYSSLPYWDLFGELSKGTSVSTVIEKYKAPFQAEVDKAWKK